MWLGHDIQTYKQKTCSQKLCYDVHDGVIPDPFWLMASTKTDLSDWLLVLPKDAVIIPVAHSEGVNGEPG